MTWLLRWFPAWRELQRELDAAAQSRILAEDRVARADNVIAGLREDLREAIARGDAAQQTVANIFAQMHTGRKVFPGAPGLGVDNRPEPPAYSMDRAPSPMEARGAATRRFIDEGKAAYAARRKQHPAA